MSRKLSFAVALLALASLAASVDLPSCAGKQAASKNDCASPCYFFKPLGAGSGTCAYGVLVVDEVNSLGQPVPSDEEMRLATQPPSAATVPGVESQLSQARQQRVQEIRREIAAGYEAMNARVKSLYDAEIERCAKKYGVPADRLRAVICAESGFNPRAVSRTGAAGLTQQQPCYAEDLVQHCVCVECVGGGTDCDPVPLRRRGCLKQGVVAGSEDERRLFDPESNICEAAKKLKQGFLRFGSWNCSHFAYLAGSGTASRFNCAPPSEDLGLRYLRRINSFYDAFRSGQCNACGRATHC